VHIDHTKVDLVLICGETREVLGRAWLSLAIDAESRAVVAFYLSFEPPSYRSCMMVIRDLVRRNGRLPDTIITDNGPEFKSRAFKRLCAVYRITLRYRPKGRPRHGSVMERIFLTTDTQFVHNLFGNTKILRNVRIATKFVAPERHAEWSLPALYGALDMYFTELYGTDPHPAHGEAPVAHLHRRLVESGLRMHRLVRFDRTLLIETCPPVDERGTRTADPQRGIKVHHLWYWTDAFIGHIAARKDVEVRVDPWDARVCYVLLGGHWFECVCNLMSRLQRLTRVELHCYFEEMRERAGLKKAELTPERLAEWVQLFDKDAFDPRLKRKVEESRIIYDALQLTCVEKAPASQAPLEKSPVRRDVEPERDLPTVVTEEEAYDIY
jgi:putative transposase